MATRNRPGGRRSHYVFQFVGTAALLVSGTLALVLYVLPERYVLSSGFREGNLNLPNPRTPFEPAEPLRIAAIPPLPVDPGPPDVTAVVDSVAPGPSELFWARVLPLLDGMRHEEAIPLFTEYLTDHPGDVGVRREYALTLAAAGYGDRAVPIFEDLIARDDSADLRLLLARTLRDAGSVDEASEHYAYLLDRAPGDESLALEWAQALSWIERYDRAESVLQRGLGANPRSRRLRAELARVYVYADRLEDARRMLDSMSEKEIVAGDLEDVRASVLFWLTPPPDSSAVVPLSLLEQAVAAREADDFERADSLFRAALDEDPENAAVWQAYADFLQYELENFDGALDALAEVERSRGSDDRGLEYRMAQLEIWTDRTDAAQARLERLLALPDQGPAADSVALDTLSAAPVTTADVLTLLGDLDRWDAERLPAVERYETALREDPEETRAAEGLALLRADVDREIIETEQPGLGGLASSFLDTDEYRRYDAGGAWTGVHHDWMWGTRTGGRWVEGYEPTGGPGTRDGLFAELEGARWWRWGTVRTGAHLDVQNVRSNSVDVGAGGSLRLVGRSGRRTELRLDHEPAYPVTRTLQSIAADVWQDRLTIGHDQPLSERWSAAVSGEVASLDHEAVPGTDRNLRLQLAASLAKIVSSSVTLGLSARALRYVDAAPDVTAIPLYWDPDASVSVGPFARLRRPIGGWWEVTARVNPGLSYIDERRRSGAEVVPDLSASLGLLRDGTKYRTSLGLFYGQGRFSGYRSFGVDLSFTARGWLGPGGER